MYLQAVSADNPDYLALARRLDDYYFSLVGDVQLRYASANDPKSFSCLLVAYQDGQAIAIGCWKAVGEDMAEIKRVYVAPAYRRKGTASAVIRALEKDIAASGRRRIVLETARSTPDSAALYLSLGYRQTDYYGSPAGAEGCLCFEKDLAF